MGFVDEITDRPDEAAPKLTDAVASEMAAIGMPIPNVSIADRNSEVSKAYRRGKAASKVKLHTQEMMLAQVGSPLAIENAHRNLLDMKMTNNYLFLSGFWGTKPQKRR